MKCVCQEIATLRGNEADAYMAEHLRLILFDLENWENLYECPETGIRWLETFPYPAAHGGGPPVLQRLRAGEDNGT
jgi:hypothetical protein